MTAFLEWLRYRREMNKIKRAGTFGIGGGTLLCLGLFSLVLGGWALQGILIINGWDTFAAVSILILMIFLPPIGFLFL